MNTDQPNQKTNILALDGMSLVLHRTLGRLVTGLEDALPLLKEAAAADFNNVTHTDELAPRANKALERMLDGVELFASDLEDLDAHWRTLPWSDALGRPDPRQNKPRVNWADVEACLRAALAGKEINPFPEDREAKPTDAAIRMAAEDQAVQEAVAALKEEHEAREAQAAPSALAEFQRKWVEEQRAQASAAYQEGQAAAYGLAAGGVLGSQVLRSQKEGAAEREAREAAEKEMVATEQEAPSMISDAGPDFDPELLAGKRLEKIDIMNDVRQKFTVGKPEVEPVLGDNKPTVWFVAADGTRLTIHSSDFQKVVDTLNRCINAGM